MNILTIRGEESLTEAAYGVAEEFRKWQQSLRAAIALLDAIADLTPE
jgi:hypothetical protein